MGLSPADLAGRPGGQAARPRPSPSTSRSCPPRSATATRRAYGSYWNRVIDHWGSRGIGRAHAVGDPAADGLRQDPRRGPAQRPRRAQRRRAPGRRAALPVQARRGRRADQPRPTTRPGRWTSRAACRPPGGPSPDNRLAEINQAPATTGDDPELDTLLLRLHTETACFSRGQFGHSGTCLMFPQFSGRSAAASGATRVVHVRCWLSQPHRMAWLSWAMSSRLAERAAVRSWSRSSSWSRRSMTCC